MYNFFLKQVIDFSIALLALIFISPVFIVIMVGLYFANRGKPFFYQDRPGKNNRIFTIIKFKTMNDKKDKNGELLPDFDRLTKLGAFVRKSSLDEIPQLINVLKGDMSLIGPRPLLPEYLPFYNDIQKRRHDVKPGISGWAQVNGRNAISWEDKFKYDVWYVDNCSFLLDLKIFWITFVKVFKREGVNIYINETDLPFQGEK
ncbi:sugar transferase [Flavobacterium paronense]|uniref:Sugar transferase n=1 Tax=Flavobacterium paronense TaxID=1392775 RepID=A0ABV5GAN1_9FLAO|nr:sugar transferase [Flavobacterium paronense]MDN3676686.1 sugar transferase [Flavobacterium paronense]